MITKGASTIQHYPHLTGTAVQTDTSGAATSTIAYYPYGETRATTGAPSTDKRFTGQRLDDATGLYYYGARYYDPALGRFVSADSLIPGKRNPQGFNRYSYVLNNPLRHTDPSGECIGPLRKVCDKAKELATDLAGDARDKGAAGVKWAVDHSDPIISAYSHAADFLEPVDVMFTPAEEFVEHVMVPSADVVTKTITGKPTGITDVEISLSHGYVGVQAEEGGLVNEIVQDATKFPAVTIPAPIPVPAPMGPSVIIQDVEFGDNFVTKHEETHVFQQDLWGPFFLPFYFLEDWVYGYQNNPFEDQADRFGNQGASQQAFPYDDVLFYLM